MVPLIDVIFLLLTFFIYSLLMMVQAEVLPVTLTEVGAGEKSPQRLIHAVTIDRQGQLFYNRQPITREALASTLTTLAQDPSSPTLYLALEQAGEVDRGPIFVDIVQLVRTSGLRNFTIVGSPQSPPAP